MKKTLSLVLTVILMLSMHAMSLAEEYQTPTIDYDVWQEYTAEQQLAENVSEKTVVYQFAGFGDHELGIYVLVNLYDDGFATAVELTAANGDYMGGFGYIYYGYWANLEDEIYIGFTNYAMYSANADAEKTDDENADAEEASSSKTRTVDYSYDLVREDGLFTFGFNACLGFNDGGQFVRNVDMLGDGVPAYGTIQDFIEASAK